MTREEAKEKFLEVVLKVEDIDLRHELRLAAIEYAHAAAQEVIREWIASAKAEIKALEDSP